MRTKGIPGTLVTIAILLFLGASTEAQLPKQGRYSGKFGWWATGTAHEVEKNHIFWVGEFNGTFFNNAGSGFLDRSSVICPGVNDIRDGVSLAYHGYCVVTDRDGDRAVLAWSGGQTPAGKFGGEFQWTGGTGKYAGITGKNTFLGFANLPTSQGYALWEGEWQLP